jgi:hypothetical protein
VVREEPVCSRADCPADSELMAAQRVANLQAGQALQAVIPRSAVASSMAADRVPQSAVEGPTGFEPSL